MFPVHHLRPSATRVYGFFRAGHASILNRNRNRGATEAKNRLKPMNLCHIFAASEHKLHENGDLHCLPGWKILATFSTLSLGTRKRLFWNQHQSRLIWLVTKARNKGIFLSGTAHRSVCFHKQLRWALYFWHIFINRAADTFMPFAGSGFSI